MSFVARLYDQCKVAQVDRVNADRRAIENVHLGLGLEADYSERKKREEDARRKKAEEKQKAKEEKEKRKRDEEERRRKSSQPKPKRKPFNFEEVRSPFIPLMIF